MHNTREILNALLCFCRPSDIEEYPDNWDLECKYRCPYASDGDCVYDVAKDAIALIKKQREMLKRYKRLYYVTKAKMAQTMGGKNANCGANEQVEYDDIR